jgi:hypothetical protein
MEGCLYTHTPLPVSYAIHAQCASDREGCLYTHTPLPVSYAIHAQCASDREGCRTWLSALLSPKSASAPTPSASAWATGADGARTGSATWRHQMYSITIQSQYMYCTFDGFSHRRRIFVVLGRGPIWLRRDPVVRHLPQHDAACLEHVQRDGLLPCIPMIRCTRKPQSVLSMR